MLRKQNMCNKKAFRLGKASCIINPKISFPAQQGFRKVGLLLHLCVA